LRRKAEEKVASQPEFTGEADEKRLLHELQVHQIELEMQNEELRRTHQELESIVTDRTVELTAANLRLTREIEERKKAEEALQIAFAEIKQLTEQLQVENIELKQVITLKDNFGEIIGQSPAIAYVFFRIDQVAPQDTTILLLGPHIDSLTVKIASKADWGELLHAGAEIHVYQPTMLHTKLLVIDDEFVSVGSTNFDIRSIRLNDEASLNIYSSDFVTQMTTVFEADLPAAESYSLAQWKSRPLREKFSEKVLLPIRSQL